MSSVAGIPNLPRHGLFLSNYSITPFDIPSFGLNFEEDDAREVEFDFTALVAARDFGVIIFVRRLDVKIFFWPYALFQCFELAGFFVKLI